ncbi:MAG: ATP-dependent helicase, partial [Acidimicrobiales bacterium]
MSAAHAPHGAPAGLVEGLDPDQAAAVLADAPVTVVLAGAGSGKTRVLTRRIARRIADGSAESRQVLALSFTRKATGELRQRLGALTGHRPGTEGAPAVHTFHAFGGALLQRWWLDRGEHPWDVTRDRRSLLDAARTTAGLPDLSTTVLGTEIEWAKARLLDPDAYEDTAGRAVDTGQVAAAWRAYEEEKRHRRILDVDDFIVVPARLLADEPAFAAARTWWHRHVFVDEAQDLNPAQLRLLTLVLGAEPDLFVVGDPDQAIYGWNGAEPTLLLDLVASLPSEAVHRLSTNHRCTAPIVAAAASILRSPTAPAADHGDGARWPAPTVTAHVDEVAEADAIAHRLQEARWRGARAWSSMAVLVRTRGQLDVIAAALAARQIPHRLPGS